ncbi:MAG: protein kinase [Planctomycetia bacterium]|nr:protein kinase [Planctomycetia bacterium]
MNTTDHTDPSALPDPAKGKAAVGLLSQGPALTSFEPVDLISQQLTTAAILSLRSSDRYLRLELHDQGGMGRIWVARDTGLDRDVALKELLPELASNPLVLARFLREARITGQLEHPGIVPVYELARSVDEQHPFYAMRFLKGRTLAQAAQDYHRKRLAGVDASLDLSVLLHAFVMVCNTIGYAHSRGVIHRDLKGQNVILGDFGEVVVLDWGLAKLVNRHDDQDENGVEVEGNSSDDPELTQQGQALGTPASMAPEQAAGLQDQINHRTDIYGLGAILYEILTGRPPFTGETTLSVLRKVLDEEPTPPRELSSDVPPGLEILCLRALAKKPEDRFDTAKELAEAVQQWQESERRKAEEALRASEEKYHSLADLIPGIVWTARADGWIDYANQFWFKFTGLTMEQTQGLGWAVTVHPDDLVRVSELWMRSLQTGEPVEVDYRIKRASDGVYRWFLAQARPVRDREGKIVKWFGMLTEIEDQKKGEKALQRENALVRLLHQVTVAAYESATVEEALQAGIDQVCAYTGWPVGHVYVLAGPGSLEPESSGCNCKDDSHVYVLAGPGSLELVPTSIWHLDRPAEFESFVQVTKSTRLAVGAGLPGRVLAGKKPLWIMDVTRDENFPRAKAAVDIGVKGAFGFPVLTPAGVVAVLEFFTSEPKEPDEVLLQAMAQIGLQLGQVFERKRTEAELREAREARESANQAKPESLAES